SDDCNIPVDKRPAPAHDWGFTRFSGVRYAVGGQMAGRGTNIPFVNLAEDCNLASPDPHAKQKACTNLVSGGVLPATELSSCQAPDGCYDLRYQRDDSLTNARDGFVLTIRDFDPGDYVSFNVFFFTTDGTKNTNTGGPYGSGTVSFCRGAACQGKHVFPGVGAF